MENWIAEDDGTSMKKKAQLWNLQRRCNALHQTLEEGRSLMALADTVELAKRREQIEAWNRGEEALALQVLTNSPLPPPPEIDEETRQSLQPFVQWTTKTNSRYCPAKPLTVAA